MLDKFRYIKIEAWMYEMEFKTFTQLGLFAIIYNFKDRKYSGAREYLSRLLLCNVKTIDRSLTYLLDKGYIEKMKQQKNYGNYMFKRTNTYVAIVNEKNHPISEKQSNDYTLFSIEEYQNLMYG